jgi:CDGSH-type Zn-finger protein/truncated hemoglobin YjbI
VAGASTGTVGGDTPRGAAAGRAAVRDDSDMNGDPMRNDNDTASGKVAVGRLAQVIATRTGKAAPETEFVIEHREALIYALCQAAELEHGIMCQYLFAAFSLKQSTAEGLTEAEAAAANRWRKQVSHVAAQEMLHLALVHNLLSAIGAAPHLARPNLPVPANHYPAGVQLALIPFGEQALRHFMFLERPEGMDLADAEGLAAVGQAVPLISQRDIVPQGQDFATVGHLYRSIEAGFEHLAATRGEDWLFVGPPRAQAAPENFRWPELVRVTDLASAKRAIEEILEQGEGPRGDWRDAHFGQFVNILDEYQQLCAANPGFDPVRPVLAANVRQHERDADHPVISDPLTARVTDLFNVSYEILLQIFERFFAHTGESDGQLQVLADATITLMVRVIKPLGDLITTLPVGPDHPGLTAGPSFELFYENDYLMPHQEAAWALLAERLDQAAWLCEAIGTGRGTAIAGPLAPVLGAMREIARTLAAHLPAGSAHAALADAPGPLDAAELDALLGRAAGLAGALGPLPAEDPGRALRELFDTAHSIVTAAAASQGCDAAHQARIVPRMTDSVLRPLADVLTRMTGPGAPAQEGARPAAAGPPQPGIAAADRVWELAKTATELRARLGKAGDCPPELAEATAALQSLACLLVRPGEAGSRRTELWRLQAGLPAQIQAAHNGPYLVTNVPWLIDHLGARQRPAPQLALCRCGQSAIKPWCDGSHARTGFRDDKDPKRVPDRRDSYPGQELTIFDNRGICQHSGLCTDRLATVFRAGAEPFVAPSGGRMDEIIRAVRDCPSGALSYAIGGIEARDQVDWGNARPPAIEVTKDGPYRITGAIALAGPDGVAVDRAEGSSMEHYALCRCGQSQNKPFCSGMHWYVNFRDPGPREGNEPGPYEWAGGLTALTRMCRLFYEKHGPADPLLAPLLADIGPDQAPRLARWLAGALGGPADGAPADGAPAGPAPTDAPAQDAAAAVPPAPGPAANGGTAAGGDDMLLAAIGTAGAEFGEPQRARWVALMSAAADDAALPADPEFRSVLSSCLEWASRTALAMAQTAALPRQRPEAVGVPAPRWDWGPAGPPAPPVPAEDDSTGDTAELPGPDQPVSFAAHVKPLFRERDRQSMSFAFDLWSYQDVSSRAAEILSRLQDGSMPCDGAWPAAKIEVFQRWADTGRQP